ncbi:hypothetical protein HYQ46_002460 [Verticillium longisporum]|nr:hypothetical protein HYQ46_002460 [Verticillium longisporum]
MITCRRTRTGRTCLRLRTAWGSIRRASDFSLNPDKVAISPPTIQRKGAKKKVDLCSFSSRPRELAHQ